MPNNTIILRKRFSSRGVKYLKIKYVNKYEDFSVY